MYDDNGTLPTTLMASAAYTDGSAGVTQTVTFASSVSVTAGFKWLALSPTASGGATFQFQDDRLRRLVQRSQFFNRIPPRRRFDAGLRERGGHMPGLRRAGVVRGPGLPLIPSGSIPRPPPKGRPFF